MLYISERKEYIRVYNYVFPLTLSEEREKRKERETCVTYRTGAWIGWLQSATILHIIVGILNFASPLRRRIRFPGRGRPGIGVPLIRARKLLECSMDDRYHDINDARLGFRSQLRHQVQIDIYTQLISSDKTSESEWPALCT